MVDAELPSGQIRRVALELFVLSIVSLFLELLIIRWMSSDFRAFTVFRTFPLIACFVGLGVGFALEKDEHFKLTPYWLLLFVLTMKLCDLANVGFWSFPAASVFQWQTLTMPLQSWPYVLAFCFMIVVVLAIPFFICVCLGSRLGVLFNQLRPLPAYCYNLGGAILGSIAFPVLCYFEFAPWQLLIMASLVLLLYVLPETKKKWLPVLCVLAIPVISLALPSQAAKPLFPKILANQYLRTATLWSPYQRIDLTVLEVPPGSAQDSASQASIQEHKQMPLDLQETTTGKFLGLELGVNRAFYQYFFRDDLAKNEVNSSLAQIFADRRRQYIMPYGFNQPKSVLVVGAGTGQNVSAALESGATQVDAVDIDPVILKVGKRYNPSYSSSKVNLICDDARHYFAHCTKRYDVINFSLLDSHAVAGQGSSVRIDCYVYTKESIARALELLKPNGIIVISFAAAAPWIGDRLDATIQKAAGYPPLKLFTREGKIWGAIDLVFVLGDPVKNGMLSAPTGWKVVENVNTQRSAIRILTDDWPYLYVQPDIVDWTYILVVAEIVLLSVFSARRFLFSKPEPAAWQMFFLGSAFLLLELHAISFLSLLYGSTWLTAAIAINGILLMIFLANLFVLKLGSIVTSRQPLIYLGLFLSIALSYLFPSSQLLREASGSDFLHYALVTTVTILPMGIAGILFSSAFSQTKDSAKALAFNLFGAVVGGLLEYLSNYLGIKALELVSAGLYFASLLCYFAQKRFLEKKS